MQLTCQAHVQAQQRGRAVEDLEGEEVEFSDDDAEAAYRATQAGDYRDNDLGLAASFAGDGPAMVSLQDLGFMVGISGFGVVGGTCLGAALASLSHCVQHVREHRQGQP